MRLFKLSISCFSCIFLGLYVTAQPLFGQTVITKINDILQSPEHYINRTVKIKGKVIKIHPEEESTSGIYHIRDSKSGETDIISEILPEVGKSYTVTVEIQQDSDSNSLVFREISRSQSNKIKYLAYIMGGVAIYFIVGFTLGGNTIN